MKRTFLYVAIAILAIIAMVLVSCVASSTTTSGAQTGSIEVRVTDAPPSQDVTSVMVTVTSVQIHLTGNTTTTTTSSTTTNTATTSTTATTATGSDSGWITLKLSGPSTFDLLKVQGLEQVLAIGDLASGQYTQIRMEVSKIQVAISGGSLQDATIPSGNLKFVQPFDVVVGKTTVILFDFDAAHSINITGNGKIMFKPVIKLVVTDTPGSLEITTPSLDNGEVGRAYTATLNVMGGTALYKWSITSGSLPNGTTLNATTGVISGTPAAVGSSSFTVKAEDASTTGQKSGIRNYNINIASSGTLQITDTSLPDGVNGVAYSTTVQAMGGTVPYTWSISAGSLPSGVTLNGATGEISGTPTANGNFSFTIQVTDSANPVNSNTQNLTLLVSPDAAD